MDTMESKHAVSKEDLAQCWGISLDKANNMLEVTTQKGIRRAVHPVTRWFRTLQPHIRKCRLKGPFYSDTCFFNDKSIQQEKCTQVTTDGKGLTHFWPETLSTTTASLNG
jgi:hypothetical protein